jgi:hypothetical protein
MTKPKAPNADGLLPLHFRRRKPPRLTPAELDRDAAPKKPDAVAEFVGQSFSDDSGAGTRPASGGLPGQGAGKARFRKPSMLGLALAKAERAGARVLGKKRRKT